MTQATPYTRTTGFADDERNNAGGRATVRTAQLDAELDAIAVPLDLTIANLAMLQRDDGVMRDGVVPPAALGADTLKLLTTGTAAVRGAWLTGTVYALKDLVTQSGNTYICAVAHVAGTFATDLAAVKWVLFQVGANPNAAAIPFSPTANTASTNVQAAIVEVDADLRDFATAAVSTLSASLASALNGAGADLLGGVGRVVSTISALKGLVKTGVGRAFVLGYYAAGGGGGGQYFYDSADTSSADNGGTIIVAADGGRWKLVKSAPITFETFGAVGDGTANDTVAMQAAITATSGVLSGTAGATYKVSSTLTLHSNIEIDLRGSTVNWAGAVITNANKASKWDNAVFRCGAVAPGAQYTNVKVRNGTINCNNWGCAVFYKRVDGCVVNDITTSLANAAGIALLDCTDFEVKRNKLTDCAADPAQGFTASTDLEAWSDGILIFYGAQAGSVENNTVISARVATGRAGIVVDDALAGSVETSRKTSGITVKGNRVQGYDRQVHVEYSNAVNVENNDLAFVDTGAKTFSTGFIDWNTNDTVWLNNRVTTTKCIAMISGSTNVNVIGGSLTKTGADTSNAFSNQSAILAEVKFRDVKITLGASSTNIYRWLHSWEDCKISSTAYLLCSHYESNGKFTRCRFTNAAMWSTGSGLATDSMDFYDCSWFGFSGTNYTVNVAAGALHIRRGTYEAGDVRVNCSQVISLTDMSLNTIPVIDGSPPRTILDGVYLGSAKPTTLAWIKGDMMRNTNPTAGGVPFFECVASGTPGTWKNHAAMEA